MNDYTLPNIKLTDFDRKAINTIKTIVAKVTDNEEHTFDLSDFDNNREVVEYCANILGKRKYNIKFGEDDTTFTVRVEQ